MVRSDRQGKPHRWVTRSGNGTRWVGVSDRFGCDRIHTHARNRAYLEHVVLGGAHDEGGPTGTRGQPGTPDRRSRGRQADARGPSGGGERWARGCVRTKGRGREHRRVHGSDRDARARSCVADGDTTSQIVPGEQKLYYDGGSTSASEDATARRARLPTSKLPTKVHHASKESNSLCRCGSSPPPPPEPPPPPKPPPPPAFVPAGRCANLVQGSTDVTSLPTPRCAHGSSTMDLLT